MPGVDPGGHVRIGGQRDRSPQRHEHVAAVRGHRQEIRRRIHRQLVDELNPVDHLVGARVHHPEEVAPPVGNPEEAVLPRDRRAVRVGVLLVALVEDHRRRRRVRRLRGRRELRQREDVEVGLIEIGGRAAARVDVHLAQRLGAETAVAVDERLVVLGDDLHRRRLAVHHEEAAAAQRDEREAAGGFGDRADRRVVRPESRRLAGQPGRRRAVGQIDPRRRVEPEVVLFVVGQDPLEQLAVLVGDRHVGAVGRRRRHVRLADAADARRRADALDRLARIRLDEEHVPGRHERDDDVRLGGIDGDHVRPHGGRARSAPGTASSPRRPDRSARPSGAGSSGAD